MGKQIIVSAKNKRHDLKVVPLGLFVIARELLQRLFHE
jgi:hypothetical protein